MATTTEWIDYTERSAAPATPATTHWRLFFKSDGAYYVDDTGTVSGPLPTSALSNPMTTSGDIIYGGASGTPTRLAKGNNGQGLVLASGIPSWQNINGAYDIEKGGVALYTDAGMSDEFNAGTLDAQWTAVGFSGTGTIDDTATNPTDSIYDLATESGTCFWQLDQGDKIGFRQDAIPAAGEQIIVAMWIPYPDDAAVGGTANSFRCGIGVNDSDTHYEQGTYRAVMWDGNDDPRIVHYTGATISSEHKYSSPASGRIYWRMKRVSSTLYWYWSRDGIGWSSLGSVAVGTFNNFWVWADASVAAGMDNAPILALLWVRHVANVNYRPW